MGQFRIHTLRRQQLGTLLEARYLVVTGPVQQQLGLQLRGSEERSVAAWQLQWREQSKPGEWLLAWVPIRSRTLARKQEERVRNPKEDN